MPEFAKLSSVAVIAGLLGYAIHTGIWGGEVRQLLIEHERRLNQQDAHMERIDRTAEANMTRFATIETQLRFLVSAARAAEADAP